MKTLHRHAAAMNNRYSLGNTKTLNVTSNNQYIFRRPAGAVEIMPDDNEASNVWRDRH